MKYIKRFENNSEYEVDDYILVSKKWFKDNQNRKCKIVEKTDDPKGYTVITSTNMPLWISDDLIVRKLTDEEIEQYNIEIDSNKYNL